MSWRHLLLAAGIVTMPAAAQAQESLILEIMALIAQGAIIQAHMPANDNLNPDATNDFVGFLSIEGGCTQENGFLISGVSDPDVTVIDPETGFIIRGWPCAPFPAFPGAGAVFTIQRNMDPIQCDFAQGRAAANIVGKVFPQSTETDFITTAQTVNPVSGVKFGNAGGVCAPHAQDSYVGNFMGTYELEAYQLNPTACAFMINLARGPASCWLYEHP